MATPLTVTPNHKTKIDPIKSPKSPGINLKANIKVNTETHSKTSPSKKSSKPTNPSSQNHNIQSSSSSSQNMASGTSKKEMEETSVISSQNATVKNRAPQINDNIGSNVQALVNHTKGIDFDGPNCHNATLMALGVQHAPYDNDDTLIDMFVDKYCTKTSQKGTCDSLKDATLDMQQGDIIVIKNHKDETVHSALCVGGGEFFQKKNQQPGAYHKTNLQGAIHGYTAETREYDYDCNYQVARPRLNELKGKNENVTNLHSKVTNQEKSFAAAIEQSWDKSIEGLKKFDRNFPDGGKSFFPVKENLDRFVAQRDKIKSLAKELDIAMNKSGLSSEDKNLLTLAKHRVAGLEGQLKSVVKSTKSFTDDKDYLKKIDKRVWKAVISFESKELQKF